MNGEIFMTVVLVALVYEIAEALINRLVNTPHS